jgi:hypothetical protein
MTMLTRVFKEPLYPFSDSGASSPHQPPAQPVDEVGTYGALQSWHPSFDSSVYGNPLMYPHSQPYYLKIVGQDFPDNSPAQPYGMNYSGHIVPLHNSMAPTGSMPRIAPVDPTLASATYDSFNAALPANQSNQSYGVNYLGHNVPLHDSMAPTGSMTSITPVDPTLAMATYGGFNAALPANQSNQSYGTYDQRGWDTIPSDNRSATYGKQRAHAMYGPFVDYPLTISRACHEFPFPSIRYSVISV